MDLKQPVSYTSILKARKNSDWAPHSSWRQRTREYCKSESKALRYICSGWKEAIVVYFCRGWLSGPLDAGPLGPKRSGWCAGRHSHCFHRKGATLVQALRCRSVHQASAYPGGSQWVHSLSGFGDRALPNRNSGLVARGTPVIAPACIFQR